MASTDWLGHGSQEAWWAEHQKMYQNGQLTNAGQQAMNTVQNSNWLGHGSQSAWEAANKATIPTKQPSSCGGGSCNGTCATGHCNGYGAPVGGSSTSSFKQTAYNQDANANLREAIIRGNEENTRSINRFEDRARELAKGFNDDTLARNNRMTGDMNGAYNGYNERTRALLGQMGTASDATVGRMRGQAYAGLDSGFAEAGNQLQASLAQRGLSGSGIFARGMGDMAQDRMRAGSEAGVQAYTQAIDLDDRTRGTQLSGEDRMYGAETGTIQGNFGRSLNQLNDSYGKNMNVASGAFNANQSQLQNAYSRDMSQLGQTYGNNLSIEGQAMQNQLNNTQQKQSNLMGYAQLGRGMQGMSQNYLSSAGTGFANIGQIAGSSAANQGQLNNSYNSTMQQANTASNAKGADMLGTAVGVGGSLAFSDIRLKENTVKVGKVNGINVYTWDWKPDALMIVGDNVPAFGVIAQEVRKTRPEAVVTDNETGYLKVDYAQIFRGIA